MRQMAVWIDRDEARLWHDLHHVHRHPKSQETRTHNHPQDELRFFGDVLAGLEGAEEILIVGPSVTKLHLLRHLQHHAPAVAARVVGLETADHPSDRQLVAHVRHYFHSDRPRQGLGS